MSSTIKSIIIETQNMTEFRGLIEVYEELAAGKMRKVKTSIMGTRDFYESLSQLSVDVGSDFHSALERENPREAVLFIAANAGLYGDIVEKTFQLFLEYVRSHKAEVFVAGKLGGELMKDFAKDISYKSIAVADDKIEEKPLYDLLKEVVTFHKILVFYGKFQNLIIQHPQMGVVSGQMFPQSEAEIQMLAKKRMIYLYEPSVYSVSELFTKEVLAGVLEQMILESQLAKFASRVMHLDRATEKVDEELRQLEGDRRKARKQTIEKKQNAMMANIMSRTF